MRIYYITLFIAVFALGGYTQMASQHYKITYDYDFSRDSTNLTASKRHIRCFLFYNQSLGTKFIGEGALFHDSLIYQHQTDKTLPIQDFIKAVRSGPKTQDFRSAVHVNQASLDEFIVTDQLNGMRYIYTEKKTIQWKVHSDISDINGYNCQKATCNYGGRDFEAWFTTEIPISSGPYKFIGLPGLVIKVIGDKGQFVFDLASLEILDNAPDVALINDKDNIETSREVLLRARTAHFNNLEESTNSSGGGHIISIEGGRDLNSEGKSKNNFIEKK